MLASAVSLSCESPYFHQASHMEAAHLSQSMAVPYVSDLMHELGELDLEP